MGVSQSMQRATVLASHLHPCAAAGSSNSKPFVPMSFTALPAHRGTALVTGGSRGIGAAIALRLAQDGYAIAINYNRSSAEASQVVATIKAAGGNAVMLQADVSSEAGGVDMFERLDAAGLPPLTALVNNAGVLVPGTDLEQVGTEAMYRRQMDTNVLGPLICCREAARRMSSKRPAVAGKYTNSTSQKGIVNISSGSAYLAGSTLYSMSKGALNSMTMNPVQPLAKIGIRVNTVSPGMTETDMIADQKERFNMSSIPMGRWGKPEEIADAVSYLLSEKASYITGANIRVSGGKPPGTHIG